MDEQRGGGEEAEKMEKAMVTSHMDGFLGRFANLIPDFPSHLGLFETAAAFPSLALR